MSQRRERLEAQFQAAEADVDESGRRVKEASAKLLRELKRQSIDRRFKALEDSDNGLLPSDRRDLVASIRATAAAKPMVGASTATWWEVFRSRLRYRIFPLGIGAATAIVAVILIGVSIHRTPQQWAVVNAPTAFLATAHYPNGSTGSERMKAGDRYAVVRIVADKAELREWVLGAGYTTLDVPVAELQAAN